jgi:PAS domain S-box-containing protein
LLPDFRVRQRDYLLEISRAITQELDLDKLLDRILTISVEMLAGQAGLIALRATPSGWSLGASYGVPPAFLRYFEPLLAEIPEREDSSNAELAEINRLLQNITRATSLGLLTGVVLPLFAQKRVIGLIFIFRNYAGSFSVNDRALLQSFADQAAVAVQNAQLYTQLSLEKRRLDALISSAADGILILKYDQTVEQYNSAFARMVNQSAANLVGLPHAQVVQLKNVRDSLTLEQAIQGGWPLTPHASLYVEGDLQRLNGQSLPVGVTYAPLLDAQGHLTNIIATARDITRFREAEELKSTFVSVVSHELKTPIALIKGYVSTLRREDANWDREIVDDSLAVIEEEADHLTDLIENLLDASRLQAGALSINRSDVALDVLVNRIAERFQTQSSNHSIQVEFPPSFPVILGDEDRLGQVLSNLLSNAIKYSPEGGEITIRGEVRPEHVIVCVSDLGPGIPAQDIPHIFDRFYRATDTARTTKGAGLGLYLARAVVEAHRGRIWVDPAPGVGARICFSLPRDESQSAMR